MQPLNLPYFAGIIDGEGHIGKPGNGLIITTTNSNLAIWLRAKVGGKLNRIKRRGKETKYKDVFRWSMQFHDVLPILSSVKGFLLLKRENVELWEAWSQTKKEISNQYVTRISPQRQYILNRLKELTKLGNTVVSQDSSNSVKLTKCDNTEPSSLTERDSYFAGIVDGEGAILIRTLINTSRRGMQFLPDIVVVNTKKQLLEWIKQRYGGRISYRKGTDQWKDRWYWNSNARNAKGITERIYPYSIVKKDHLRLLKRFYALPRTDTPSRWGKGEILPNAKFLTDLGWKHAQKIVRTMSILNHKKSLLVTGKGVETFKGNPKGKIKSEARNALE